MPLSTDSTLGITCPHCSTLLDSVLYTRPATRQILRVRKCSGCRRRIRTAEAVVAVKQTTRFQAAAVPAAV